MAIQATAAGVLPCPPAIFSTPKDDPVRYRVEIVAPSVHDWSLRQLIPDPSGTFRERLGIALATGPSPAQTIAYAPSVTHMSAAIHDPSEFTDVTHLPSGVSVARPPVPCDGLPVPMGSKVVMSTGGCALLVLTGQGFGRSVCIAAHAGLDSLIDPFGLHQQGTPRPHGSVIEAMLEAADLPPKLLTFRGFYALPWQGLPRATNDLVHSEKNRRLLAHLADFYPEDVVRTADDVEHVDLAQLIWHQANQLGIGTIQVAHEYQLPVRGRYAYTTHPLLGLGGRVRNLVILTRW